MAIDKNLFEHIETKPFQTNLLLLIHSLTRYFTIHYEFLDNRLHNFLNSDSELNNLKNFELELLKQDPTPIQKGRFPFD